MKTEWEFDLVLTGIPDIEEAIDALFEAGCNDATVSQSGGETTLSFIREGEHFLDVLRSTIDDVSKAQLGGTFVRLGPDDLVSAADIARRLKVSREAVRKWGDSGLPPSVHYAGSSPLRSWYEVARWLQASGRRDGYELEIERAQGILAWNEKLKAERFKEVVSLRLAK